MTKRPVSAFYFHAVWQALACFFFLTAAFPPSGYGAEAELLSDTCIDEITGGAIGIVPGFIEAFFETPSQAELEHTTSWWGDMDGDPLTCLAPPGFIVTKFPYDPDYQYDTFKYSFDSQEALDNFIRALASGEAGDEPVNIIDTDFIKSNPDAEKAFLNDGRKIQVREIVISTDRKVAADFVRAYGGQVITQGVRFDMEFSAPYLRSYTVYKKNLRGITRPTLERSSTFRNYIQFEWLTRPHPLGLMGSDVYEDVVYAFGAVFLDAGVAGPGGIRSESGELLVPEGKTYTKSTLFNDVRIHCPDLPLSIGLAPMGLPIPSWLVRGDQTHEPDMDQYQELGLVHIKDLDILQHGGQDIYMYANEYEVTCP